MNTERHHRRVAAGITAFVLAMIYIGLLVYWGWPKPQCRRCAAQDQSSNRRQQ